MAKFCKQARTHYVQDICWVLCLYVPNPPSATQAARPSRINNFLSTVKKTVWRKFDTKTHQLQTMHECACFPCPPRGVSSCSSGQWGGHIFIFGAKNSGWQSVWLSEWCNLTPATRCHDKIICYATCYLATSFIRGWTQREAQFSQGRAPRLPLEPPLPSLLPHPSSGKGGITTDWAQFFYSSWLPTEHPTTFWLGN